MTSTPNLSPETKRQIQYRQRRAQLMGVLLKIRDGEYRDRTDFGVVQADYDAADGFCRITPDNTVEPVALCGTYHCVWGWYIHDYKYVDPIPEYTLAGFDLRRVVQHFQPSRKPQPILDPIFVGCGYDIHDRIRRLAEFDGISAP